MVPNLYDRIDLDKLLALGLVARAEHHETIASTHDRAHEVARGPHPGPLPLVVVAEQQTAGRGRGANRWWTGRGSLAFSLLFDPADWNLPNHPLPERSLAVGVAIVDTLRPLLDDQGLGLHWPNDVFVSDRKVAGVLIDVVPGGRHVVGIGMNVNNTLADAPDDVRARAVSLHDLTGRWFDRTALLASLLENLQSAVRQSAVAPQEFGARYDQLCLQHGRELTIEVGTQQTRGLCMGIDVDGALLLETAAGPRKFYSGVLRS